MNDFNIEKIHDKIWIFKNAYKYSQDFIDYYESLPPFGEPNDNWEAWYTFGDHRRIITPALSWESFPTQEDFNAKVFKSIEKDQHKNHLVEEALNSFYHVTKKYLEENNISLPNWRWEPFDIASYNPGAGAGIDHGMSFHTDFQYERKDEPGSKFGYTCLFYLNDNYEGGEIMFKELSDDLNEILWKESYKPSAGDIIVFPSGHPIYHATRKCQINKKYLLRFYWRYEFEGSSEYWSERKRFSNEEDWEIYISEKRKQAGIARGISINNNDSDINRGKDE